MTRAFSVHFPKNSEPFTHGHGSVTERKDIINPFEVLDGRDAVKPSTPCLKCHEGHHRY